MFSFKNEKILLVTFLLVQTACLFGQAQTVSPSYSADQTFSFSDPQSEQFSSKGLQDLLTYVKEKKVNIHSLLIIRHRKIIFDAYFYPFRPNLQHDVASCTKSITSLLIGIAIDKGFITNEEQLVSGFFPEISAPAKGFETLTIKDLLTMTSGLNCKNSNEDSLFGFLFQSPNWADFIFHIPFEAAPGAQFSYCSCNYYLLAEIIFRATKLSPGDFAKKYLFDPIGIHSVYWTKNDKGINYGWGDLALKPMDMAKIGQLLLDNGGWKGRTIVSSAWIKKAITMNTRFENGNGYGYGFWLDRDLAYNAEGRGGQRIHVDPVHKTIIVLTGGGFDVDDKGGIGDIIRDSHHYDQTLKNDPLAYNALKKLEHQADLPVRMPPYSSPSAEAKARLLNKTLVFPKNGFGIKTAEVVSENERMFFKTTSVSGQTIVYPLGIGATYQFYTEPASGHLFGLRGYWKSDSEFEIEFNMLSRINRNLIDFSIGNEIQVSINEPTHGIHESFPVSLKL